MLQSQLRGLMGTGSFGASTAFATLSDIGFEMQQRRLDQAAASKLDAALANLPELHKVFANPDSCCRPTKASPGASRLASTDVLGSDGTLSNAHRRPARRIDREQGRQERLEDASSRSRSGCAPQYTALDAQMAALNGLSSYLAQQFAHWNKPRSSDASARPRERAAAGIVALKSRRGAGR